MASPGWMFVLTDLAGTVLGEVMNASSRQIVLPLKSTPTVTFKIQTTNFLANYFTTPTWDGMVKAYQNGVLKFVGPVVSSQEVGDTSGNSAIQVTAAGPFWRLNYRLAGIPLSSPGVIGPYTMGTLGSPVDLGLIARDLLSYANTEDFTGIDNGTWVASSNGAVGPLYLAPIGDAIMSLASGVNTIEWEVEPMEPGLIHNIWQATPVNVLQIGKFNCKQLIGGVKPNVVFEYGTDAANVTDYSNGLDRQGMMNFGYITQPAVSDFSGVLSAENTGSSAVRGRFFGVVDNAGVQFDNYRSMLLNTSINIRGQARQILSFKPRPSANYAPLVDYNVGDQVRCRVFSNGSFRFDAMFRIWGIQLDINEEGTETPTLTLVPS